MPGADLRAQLAVQRPGTDDPQPQCIQAAFMNRQVDGVDQEVQSLFRPQSAHAHHVETAFFEGWPKGLGLLIDPLQIDGVVERDNSVRRQAVVLADALPHSVRYRHDAVGRPVSPPQEPVFERRETARAEGYVERRVGAHDRDPRGGPKPTGAGRQERHLKVAFAEDVDPLAA